MKEHPLTTACINLANNAVALKALYQDRNECEDRLLAVPEYGAAIGAGKEFKWDRFWVGGEIIRAEFATPQERRRLHQLPDGSFLKIKIREEK